MILGPNDCRRIAIDFAALDFDELFAIVLARGETYVKASIVKVGIFLCYFYIEGARHNLQNTQQARDCALHTPDLKVLARVT